MRACTRERAGNRCQGVLPSDMDCPQCWLKNVDNGRESDGKTVDAISEAVLPILKRHGVTRAGIFGSCARGEMTADSDIDVLVEIRRDIGLLDFIRIKLEIEEALGQKVDLVEYDSVKPRLKDRILREQVQIL